MKYRICEYCGSNIDHGETCECRKELHTARKIGGTVTLEELELFEVETEQQYQNAANNVYERRKDS